MPVVLFITIHVFLLGLKCKVVVWNMLFQIVYRFTPKFGMLDKYFWQIANFNTSSKYFCQNLKLGLKNRWNARWNPYWNDAEWLRLMELWASQKGNFLSSRPDSPCRIFHGSSKNEMKGRWLDIVRLGLSIHTKIYLLLSGQQYIKSEKFWEAWGDMERYTGCLKQTLDSDCGEL
jgi:hypothetical protein